MPELPEVQTIVDGLKNQILNKKILQIKVFDKKLLNDDDAKFFIKKTVLSIERRGKYILLFFKEGGGCIIHLRMTGQFFVEKDGFENFRKGDRAAVFFEDAVLIFRDVRRFGTFDVFHERPDSLKLGIDPLSNEFTKEVFERLLKSSSSGIKAFLLKQDKIAGIGNIYADEALFLAKIHPLHKTSSLSHIQVRALHHAIIEVLKKGLENKGTRLGSGLGNYRHINGEGSNFQTLQVYGKKDGVCPRCHRKLIKEVIASRGTTYCPHCQILKALK
jgi:formamidopyrimidine-DNA glycosylase